MSVQCTYLKIAVCTIACNQSGIDNTISNFRLFERGSHHFNVVLGDANLNIDLPFGVQNHEISEVIVHENYRPEDEYHHEDIGKYISCDKILHCLHD